MPYHKYILELEELTNALNNHPRKVGFNHPFYVPGLVGLIQEYFVERKMDRVAELPIFKGMGYYECADKITELVLKACEARKESYNFEKSNEDEDNLSIMSCAFNAVNAWVEVYPEIAHWRNRQFGENIEVSTFFIVIWRVEGYLSDLIYFPKEKRKLSSFSVFLNRIRTMVWKIAVIGCNIIFIVAVMGIFCFIMELIFG